MNPLQRVAALADEAATTPSASSNEFDLAGFMARHGLKVRKEKSRPDGAMLYELQACPFNPDHTKGGAFITRGADGRLGFGCHHNSCAGKDWKALRTFLEPDYQSRAKAHSSQRAHQSASTNGTAQGVSDTNQKAAHEEIGDPKATDLDPAQVVADVERLIRQYMVLPDAAYLPVAIWTIGTHVAQHFDCYPYIALLSPAKRSGKTRLLEVMNTLVYRPCHGTTPTPAALFRMMAESPTLLLDEVEAFNAKNRSEVTQAILAILQAGHRKGATVPRCEPPKNEVKHFPVYGPKVFAAIGRLPDTLTDRSIVISMQRRTKDQKVRRFLARRAETEAKLIRDGMISFARDRDYQGAIGQAYERLLDLDLKFLTDRDADLWIPLFAICSVSASDQVAQLQKCAVTLSGSKAAGDREDSLSLKVLADIRTVWPEGQEGPERCCFTKTLLERLKSLEESPWDKYGLSPHKVARMLRPFEVESRDVRIGAEVLKGYEYRSLQAAFSRYLEV